MSPSEEYEEEYEIDLLCELCLERPDSLAMLQYDTLSRHRQQKVWVCDDCAEMVQHMTAGMRSENCNRRFRLTMIDAIKKGDRHRSKTLQMLLQICRQERRPKP